VINNRTNYAIRALCELAQKDKYFSNSESIAKAQNIPKKFLPQILSDLSRFGYVRSVRGFGGGVRLSRPPEKISLLEIIEVIQGNIFMYDSMGGASASKHGIDGKLMDAYKKAQEAMKAEFKRISIGDLASVGKGKKSK